MSDDAMKILVPILTFVLGSALTVALKTVEQRRDAMRAAAREAARLTKEWYVQLHTLALSPSPERLEGAINTVVYDYVHNRLILPDFLLHLEVLRSKRRAASLVDALESFLNDVTNVRPFPLALRDGYALECRYFFPRLSESPELSESSESAVTLRDLDLHVQRVAREAAKLLG